MKRSKTRILIECAMMVALSAVLGMMVIYEAPYGGSVTLFSLVPMLIIGFRHGAKWGFAASFVYSVINLLLGLKNLAYIPTPEGIIACIFLDYIIAFTFIGTAGFFKNMRIVKNDNVNFVLTTTVGTLVATILRFVCHVVSGAVIWYSLSKVWYADDPTHIVNQYGPWLYSVIYNLTFTGPEVVLTLLATPVLRKLLDLVDRRRV
ncbi:MAG: energy-coupled thiamine transporter ThiT [Clostridia bacterium]|nr:energy-coupled thiamine transporter ThiT [Clostridia bacterium]